VAILSNKIRTAEIYHQELTLTTRDLSIIEKFVINLAIGAYSLPYFTLKQALVDNFINNRPEIDSIIPLVTNHDQAHQIRFKDELKGEYDPYALFKLYSLQLESSTTVATKYGKDETFDQVSGKYDESAPDYLKQIQKNIFQSSLPQFLSGYVQNFSDAISELLHPALKLILLNLQVTNEAITKENSQKDALLENITHNYLSEAFKAGLNKINQDEKYKECRLCINKIKVLLKALTGDTESSESAEQDHHQKATQEEQLLKQKALDRMNKLKEQFAKKQALFADKNKPAAATESDAQNVEEVKKDSEGLVCQHCLEALGPQSEDYGFPIYITFTNNFYETDKEVVFKEQDYIDLSKISWWPVISSCHHYYHKKCYQELHSQNNITREDKAIDFISVFETQCSLCKSLCNNFVCVNNSKNSGFYDDLPKDLTVHVFELKEKLFKKVGAPPKKEFAVDVPSEEIFRRAYEYFIEAFHLYEEPKQLKKSFELYVFLLRSLSCSLSERRRLDFVESSLLRQISQKFKTEVNPNFLLEYQPEALLDRELFKILTLDRASETHNDELIRSHMTSLLEEYLTFKVIQLLATEKTTDSSVVKVQDCVEYFKNNVSFQEKVRRELVFPLKKIVLSWCLNLSTSLDFSFVNSDLFDLLGSSSSKGDLSDLLSQCGLTSSFEDRVLKALQHHSIDPASEVLLNSVLNTKSLSSIPAVPKARKMAPCVVRLPRTYAEYSNKYIKIKCSLCHKLNVPIGLAICLICNHATCFMCCSTHGEKGNLNNHAIKYHLGLGYFLDKISLDRWVINSPKNGYLAIKEIYIDDLGQPIKTMLLNQFTVHKVDFKKYLLNPQIDQEMQETIRYHNFGKALFKGVIEVQDRFANGIW